MVRFQVWGFPRMRKPPIPRVELSDKTPKPTQDMYILDSVRVLPRRCLAVVLGMSSFWWLASAATGVG